MFILLLVLTLLISPVKIRIKYSDDGTEPQIYARYLFLKYPLLTDKKQKESALIKYYLELLGKRMDDELNKISKLKTEKLKSTTDEKASFQDKLDFLIFLLDFFVNILGEFFNHLKIKIAVINIVVGTEDAAKTAILYGAFSQSVDYILEFLDNISQVKNVFKYDVSVYPDFLAKETSMNLDISFFYRPIRAILLLIVPFYK